MKPTDGRRTWIKLWVNDWLEGTTRYQMSDGQRAFWIDLLAMAGRSRFGGVVCSGRDGSQWIGYPLVKFQGLLCEPIDVLQTLELFKRTGKITYEVTSESPKLFTIFISSWAKYQSEYERQKRSRSKRVTPESTDELQSETRNGYATEVEIDSESELDSGPEEYVRAQRAQKQQKQKKESAQTARDKAAAATVLRTFKCFRMRPFGDSKFQEIWVAAYAELLNEIESCGNKREPIPNDSFTAAMESAIANCRKAGINVPPLFFKLKRQIETLELDRLFEE